MQFVNRNCCRAACYPTSNLCQNKSRCDDDVINTKWVQHVDEYQAKVEHAGGIYKSYATTTFKRALKFVHTGVLSITEKDTTAMLLTFQSPFFSLLFPPSFYSSSLWL